MSTTPGESSTQRVGDAERQAAIAQLKAHWEAGRLDPTEHEARTTKAYAAVTRGDLDALFADLPALPAGGTPHDAVAPTATPGTPMAYSASSPAPSTASAPSGQGGLIPQTWWIYGKRNAIVALTPFIALGLFLLTDQWPFFLLVPVVAVVLFAGDDGSHTERHRERDERRRRNRGG
ncbi:MAG: DUF1707 domain-containing protein [Lapillicoccus sp.]